jgi:hypothetical protein
VLVASGQRLIPSSTLTVQAGAVTSQARPFWKGTLYPIDAYLRMISRIIGMCGSSRQNLAAVMNKRLQTSSQTPRNTI